jgi:hypothetical protein
MLLSNLFEAGTNLVTGFMNPKSSSATLSLPLEHSSYVYMYNRRFRQTTSLSFGVYICKKSWRNALLSSGVIRGNKHVKAIIPPMSVFLFLFA